MTLESNVSKTALIFEGGGYRGAYTAGIANALLSEGIYFDFVCGISAGASHTVNYVSRDQWRTKESFMARMERKKLGGLRSFLLGNGYFNADYLYRGALEDGSLPFDFETFSNNPARIAIQAFERDSGKSIVFTKEDMQDASSLVDHVRASATLPYLMKSEPIEGTVYLDGGLGEGGGIGLSMAEDAGFERFFVVLTREEGYRKEVPSAQVKKMIGRVAHSYPYLKDALLLRYERYNATLDRLEELKAEGRAYVIYPDTMPVSNTTLSFDRLQAAYDMGLRQARRDMESYKDFIFGGE